MKINPKGAVPALVLDGGEVITESLAVLEIHRRCGSTISRLGADGPLEWARLNERLAELVSDVHKAWGPVFAPQRYTMSEANYEDVQPEAAFVAARQAVSAYGQAQFDRQNLVAVSTVSTDCRRVPVRQVSLEGQQPEEALRAIPLWPRFKARLDDDRRGAG